jgi:hypothetical protein
MKRKSSLPKNLLAGIVATLPFLENRYTPNFPTLDEIVQKDDTLQVDDEVEEVPNSSIPRGITAFWSPKYQRGAVKKDIPEFYKRHGKIHEYKHKYGLDGSPHGEHLADAYAAAETGNPDLIRGPFYRPPIFLG